jgi:hypothetical protein
VVVLADPSLPHQIVLRFHVGRIMLSCNCLRQPRHGPDAYLPIEITAAGNPDCATVWRAWHEARDRAMSAVVIQCVGLAGFHIAPGAADPTGLYLRSYDPEGHDGRGDADWTADLAQAKVFASPMEAFEEWRRVPNVLPVRPDGQPNRPLTAYSVTFPDPLPAGFRKDSHE